MPSVTVIFSFLSALKKRKSPSVSVSANTVVPSTSTSTQHSPRVATTWSSIALFVVSAVSSGNGVIVIVGVGDGDSVVSVGVGVSVSVGVGFFVGLSATLPGRILSTALGQTDHGEQQQKARGDEQDHGDGSEAPLARSPGPLPIGGDHLGRVDPAGAETTVELLEQGLHGEVQEPGVGGQEPAHVGGREEVEVVRLHAHQEVGSYSRLLGGPLEAHPLSAASFSQVRTERRRLIRVAHVAPTVGLKG